MGTIFKQKYNLPPATASDVEIQRFGIIGQNSQALADYLQANAIDQDEFPITADYPASQTESGEFYVDLPDTLILSIEDIDASGQTLGPVTKSINATDTVAPPLPDADQLGISSSEQVS